jgi:hypothetical protein
MSSEYQLELDRQRDELVDQNYRELEHEQSQKKALILHKVPWYGKYIEKRAQQAKVEDLSDEWRER